MDKAIALTRTTFSAAQAYAASSVIVLASGAALILAGQPLPL